MSNEEAIKYMETVKIYCDDGNLPEQYMDAIEIAIEALKKQIPVKTSNIQMNKFGVMNVKCGKCGEEFMPYFEFCPWCGQKTGECDV